MSSSRENFAVAVIASSAAFAAVTAIAYMYHMPANKQLIAHDQTSENLEPNVDVFNHDLHQPADTLCNSSHDVQTNVDVYHLMSKIKYLEDYQRNSVWNSCKRDKPIEKLQVDVKTVQHKTDNLANLCESLTAHSHNCCEQHVRQSATNDERYAGLLETIAQIREEGTYFHARMSALEDTNKTMNNTIGELSDKFNALCGQYGNIFAVVKEQGKTSDTLAQMCVQLYGVMGGATQSHAVEPEPFVSVDVPERKETPGAELVEQCNYPEHAEPVAVNSGELDEYYPDNGANMFAGRADY